MLMNIINACSLSADHSYFKQCSEIHSKEIPNGFLPTLGIDFLSRLYDSFSKSKHSFLLLAIEQNKVLGFILLSSVVFLVPNLFQSLDGELFPITYVLYIIYIGYEFGTGYFKDWKKNEEL